MLLLIHITILSLITPCFGQFFGQQPPPGLYPTFASQPVVGPGPLDDLGKPPMSPKDAFYLNLLYNSVLKYGKSQPQAAAAPQSQLPPVDPRAGTIDSPDYPPLPPRVPVNEANPEEPFNPVLPPPLPGGEAEVIPDLQAPPEFQNLPEVPAEIAEIQTPPAEVPEDPFAAIATRAPVFRSRRLRL